MADDLPLTIEWRSVMDFMSCPVCMCPLQNTYITTCGHRYCGKCITECIDRHHKCPCCNKPLRKDHLIKDHQYDDLVAVTAKQREKSEKMYFENIINTAEVSMETEGSHTQSTGRDPMRKILSPVEHVLKEHLKNSLASHERYYQELKGEFLRKKSYLEEQFQTSKAQLYDEGLGGVDTTQKLEMLREELEEQKRTLEGDMERCGDMVAQAFDKYLSEHIPSLSILPVTITLSLLNKGLQLADINIKPHDSLEDIKRMLRRQMEINGDRIIEFGDNVKFLCFGPLAKRSLYEMHRMAQDVVELNATHPDILVLEDNCRPILQYHMKPGSEVAVYGRVKCESDLPKSCFVTTFDPNTTQPVDYFSCKDCRFNWVCRSCMETCHKDHNVVPYIMNHQPTWACCYCPKKKKCVLQSS